MFVLKTSSPKIRRGAPKKAPRTTVPSSRTRDPSISLDPHPIFDSVYERFPRAENIRRPCRLRGSREIEIVQPRDHLVPVTPLPIHAATGGTAPKGVMPDPDSLRDEPLHVLGHCGDEDLVAERATGERIDESEGQSLGDFANLFLQIVRANLDRPGNAGREFFVPRQEDPVLGPRSLNQGPIRSRLRIRGVVADETLRSSTLAPSGVLPLESSTIRRGFRPFTYSAFTVSFGSSFRTVPIPTRTASAFARSAWTRRRSSSLLKRTGFPPESAIFPSTLIAALMTTCGRTSIRCAVRINNLCGFGAKFIYRVELRGSVRSHEGSPGPRRRPALPSDRRRDRGSPIRCRRPRDPAGSESGARRPPLRDGLHRRRR